MIFPNMNLAGLYVKKRIIIYWHIFHSSGFHHICNIKCRLDCRYSPQNIFNAKNFNGHKKPIYLFNVPICTQGMQRTWWPEAGTIIVTGPYWTGSCLTICGLNINMRLIFSCQKCHLIIICHWYWFKCVMPQEIYWLLHIFCNGHCSFIWLWFASVGMKKMGHLLNLGV